MSKARRLLPTLGPLATGAAVGGGLSWAIVHAGGPWLAPVALLVSLAAGYGNGWLWARWKAARGAAALEALDRECAALAAELPRIRLAQALVRRDQRRHVRPDIN